MAKKKEQEHEERLEQLRRDWEAPPASSDKFTAFDLRLLLENFDLLQERIRHIITIEPHANTDSGSIAVTEAGGLPNASKEIKDTKRKLVQAQSKVNELKEKIKKLEGERDQLNRELADLATAQPRTGTAPELVFLRSDPQLAKDMGLGGLPADDTQALIQIVAVLAQIDNLKRLWDVLKERCEADKRPATHNESALLQAALAWHNHNWDNLPYRLIDAAPNNNYDYKNHLRSRHVTSGETVIALHLPGIADSSGKVLCKALVQTQ